MLPISIQISINSALAYFIIPFSYGTLFQAIGINSGFTIPIILTLLGTSLSCLTNYVIGQLSSNILQKYKTQKNNKCNNISSNKYIHLLLKASPLLSIFSELCGMTGFTCGLYKYGLIRYLIISQIAILISTLYKVRHFIL